MNAQIKRDIIAKCGQPLRGGYEMRLPSIDRATPNGTYWFIRLLNTTMSAANTSRQASTKTPHNCADAPDTDINAVNRQLKTTVTSATMINAILFFFVISIAPLIFELSEIHF
jgi:hypothetical protein